MGKYYIGLMSGTSADAIDAALVSFDPALSIQATHNKEIPGDIKSQLESLIVAQHCTLSELSELDAMLGETFASAAMELMEKSNISAQDIAAIGSHGQTIFHQPSGQSSNSLQIGDPNRIAEITKIKTVSDFRRRDMCAGGQGAPLVPAFHAAMFSQPDKNRVVINIGGIANLTVLLAKKQQEIIGFDTGPGNTLMDQWCKLNNKGNYDAQGLWAATGKVNDELLQQLLKDDYFNLAIPKSTGREYFNLDWLKINIPDINQYPTQDIQATLSELTIQTISDAINKHAIDIDEILVCGGGAHNHYLMQRLQQSLTPVVVHSTLSAGIDPDWVEAIAFAWLAKQTLEGKAGNVPSVTGASHEAILGAIYQ